SVDAVGNRQGTNPLYPGADALKARVWFTMEGTQGQRVAYKPGDGEVTFMRNGAPSTTKISNPKFDPTQVGSTIKLKVGGKSDTYMVNHATRDEIVAAAGKNPNGTNRLAFHDNPVFTETNALDQIQSSLEKLRLIRDVTESPEFQAVSTRSRAEANEKGLIETKLPQFKGTYMPPSVAWTMDDFVRQGFDGGAA